MAQLLQGNKLAETIQRALTKDIESIKDMYGQTLRLCAIQVGQNHESELYLEFQEKVARKISVDFVLKQLPAAATKEEAAQLMFQLNKDPNTHGIILQLPLPKHLDKNELRCLLDPAKDVEGVHPENLGKLMLKRKGFLPCTACAVMELLKQAGVKLRGKEAVIVGHSAIVGKPLSIMLMNELATTTVCHIATSERGLLAEHVQRAEILVVAVGKPNLIQGEWIKKGAVVIDVGINCVGDKIVGDVEFEKAQDRAALITPVPGGVGPVTVALLMQNLVKAATEQLHRDA